MVLKNVWVFVLFVILVTLQLSNGAYLRCYGKSVYEYDEEDLEQAEKLLKSSYYNHNFDNFIYAFGFTGKVNGNYTIKVLNALLKLHDRNVFVLNWEKEASGITTFGSFGYIFSYIVSGLPNSVKVGLDLGTALQRMFKKGFNLSKTHAMGHSLGAHVLGNAGRYLVDIDNPIKRISGCDPAGAFYDRYLAIMPALDKNCADFVDHTFTDPGGYAMNSSNAHLAVWVNYGNFLYGPEEEQVQPGCPIGVFDMFTQEDLCSHNRCLELWIATWAREKIQVNKAIDYWTWDQYTQAGIVTRTVLLGDHTDDTSFGNYYTNTTGSPPYQPAMGERLQNNICN